MQVTQVQNICMKTILDLTEILFPARCLGCSILSLGLCPRCKSEWSNRNHITHLPETIVYSSRHYSSTAKNILIAAKEQGVVKARQYLNLALQDSFSYVVNSSRENALLVPIPSQKSSIRKRGRDFLPELTRDLAIENKTRMANILVHSRLVLDQSTLHARDRFANLSGALSTRTTLGRGEKVILIDDLVTTGATLGEAVRTLEGAGFQVVSAVTACVALPLR